MRASHPVPQHEMNVRHMVAVGGTIFEQVLATCFWTFLAYRLLGDNGYYALPPIVLMSLYFTVRNMHQRLELLAEQNFDHLDTAMACRRHRSFLSNVELEHARDKIHQWKAFCTFGSVIMGGLSYISSLWTNGQVFVPGVNQQVSGLGVAAVATLGYVIFCCIRWNHHIKTGRIIRHRVHLLDMRVEDLEISEFRSAVAVGVPLKTLSPRKGLSTRALEREPAAAAAEDDD